MQAAKHAGAAPALGAASSHWGEVLELASRLKVDPVPLHVRFLCSLLVEHQQADLGGLQGPAIQPHLPALAAQPWRAGSMLSRLAWPHIKPSSWRSLSLALELLLHCLRHLQAKLPAEAPAAHTALQRVQAAHSVLASCAEAAPDMGVKVFLDAGLGPELQVLAQTHADETEGFLQLEAAARAKHGLSTAEAAGAVQQLGQHVYPGNAKQLAACLQHWALLLSPQPDHADLELWPAGSSTALQPEAVFIILICKMMAACKDDEGDMLQQWAEARGWLSHLPPAQIDTVVRSLTLDEPVLPPAVQHTFERHALTAAVKIAVIEVIASP